MNALPSFSRASCARSCLAQRATSTKSIPASTTPFRPLSTNTQPRAQPIKLTSTTSASPSESSDPLTTSTLSRARTDPEHPAPSTPSTQSPFLLLGTISRTGTMSRTIQITQQAQQFVPSLQKSYTRPRRLLAHDPHPAGYLREGDVVEFGLFSAEENQAREARRQALEDKLVAKGVIRKFTKKGREVGLEMGGGVKKGGVRYVVRKVVTPFGVGVEERLGKMQA